MARDRLKVKGRRNSGRFALIPDNVLRSPELHSVPGEAVRVLLALAGQCNGHNNGNLSAALSVVRAYGITSSDTLSRSLRALEEAGLIVKTREGMFACGLPSCALYALAWSAVDECPGKGLTVPPTRTPLRTFRPAELAERSVRKSERAAPKIGAGKHEK